MSRISAVFLLALLAAGVLVNGGARVGAAPEPGTWEPTSPPPGFTTQGIEWIKIQGINGRSFTTAVSRPAGRGPFPLVVILHGGSGVRPEHVELAAELSRAGFMAVAGCWTVPVQPNPAVCGEAPPRADLAADPASAARELITAARSLPGAGNRFAIVGTSLGGWAALWAAANGPRPDAVVLDAPAHHCPCPGAAPWPPSRATSEVLSSLNAPVLVFHVNGDPTVPSQYSREYETAALEAGKAVTTVYLEGNRHPAALSPVAGARDLAAETEAQKRAIAFLRAALVTPTAIRGTATSAQLVPPGSATASAPVSVTFNDQTNDLGYTITLNGLSPAQVTSVTLNRGASGSNGPVLHNLAMNGSQAVSGWVRLATAEAADLRAGNLYITLQSQASPNGFARLQLTPSASTAGSISPPNTGDAGLK